MSKAKKIKLIEGLPSDWYSVIADKGCEFEVKSEDENWYYIIVGGIRFGIYKEHVKVIEWVEVPYADRQEEWIEKYNKGIINNTLETALMEVFPERAEELIKKVRANIDSSYQCHTNFKSAGEALQSAFVWGGTPEEFDYWSDIYKKLIDWEKNNQKEILK